MPRETLPAKPRDEPGVNRRRRLQAGLAAGGFERVPHGRCLQLGAVDGATFLAALPVVIFYIYLQKYMIQGLTAGAVKG